jgi:hypothetical protein
MIKQHSLKAGEPLVLTVAQSTQVSGGIAEKEGLYPRKFGDIQYEVYVDGMYWGTTYAGHGATINGTRSDPLIHL